MATACLGGPRTHPAWRVALLLCGCLLTALSSNVWSIVIYANSLKATFNMTQTQVEVCISLLNMGFMTGFPAGVVVERVGPGWALGAGGLLGAGCYIVLYTAVLQAATWQGLPRIAVIMVVCYLAGFASSFSYIVPTWVSYRSFSERHRAKVIALVDGCTYLGLFCWTLVYSTVYTQGHLADPAEQDLGGFFLMFAVLLVVINFGSIPFIRVYVPPAEPIEGYMELTSSSQSSLQPDPIHQEAPSAQPDPAPKDSLDGAPQISLPSDLPCCARTTTLMREPTMLIYSAGMVLVASVQMAFILNTTVFLKSFGLEKYHGVNLVLLCSTLPQLSAFIMKVPQGALSDYMLTRWRLPRVTLEVGWNSLQTLALIALVFWADKLAVFITCLLIIIQANGVTWMMGPTRAADYFGPRYFGRDYGCVMFWISVAQWITQTCTGVFYDMAIDDPGSLYCYGLHCFTGTLMLLAVMSAGAVVFNVLAFIRDRRHLLERQAKARTAFGSSLEEDTQR